MAEVLNFVPRPVPAPATDPRTRDIGFCNDALAACMGQLVRVTIVGVDLDGNEFRMSTNEDRIDILDMAAAMVSLLERDE